jgi:hypothetical protein
MACIDAPVAKSLAPGRSQASSPAAYFLDSGEGLALTGCFAPFVPRGVFDPVQLFLPLVDR